MIDDCKNCIHWHEWSEKRYADEERRRMQILGDYYTVSHYSLKRGDCDKIPQGTEFTFELDDGSVHTAKYDGWSFEDECYDECFHCFEGREE